MANLSIDGTLNVGGSQTIGDNPADLVSFYGAAPVAQPAVLAAVTTTAPVATFGWGFATSQQATLTIAALNTVIANMKTLGLMATS